MASSQDSNPPPNSPFGGPAMDHNSGGRRTRETVMPAFGSSGVPIPHGIPQPINFDEGEVYFGDAAGPRGFGSQQGHLNRLPQHMAERVYENQMPLTVARAAHAGPATFSQGMAHLDATKQAMNFYNQLGAGTDLNIGGQPLHDVLRSSTGIPGNYRGTFGTVGQMLAAAHTYTTNPQVTQNLVDAGMANFAREFVTEGIYGANPVNILTQNYNNAVQSASVAGGGLRPLDTTQVARIMGQGGDPRANLMAHARTQMQDFVGSAVRTIGPQYDNQSAALRQAVSQQSPPQMISVGEMIAGQAYVHNESARTQLGQMGFPLDDFSAPVSYRDALSVADQLNMGTYGAGAMNNLYTVNPEGGVRPVMSESQIETFHEAQGAVSVGSAVEAMSRQQLGDTNGRLDNMAAAGRSGGGRTPPPPRRPTGGGDDDDGEGAMNRLAAAAERAAAALGMITSAGERAGGTIGGATGGLEQGFAPRGPGGIPAVTDAAVARQALGLPAPLITDPSRLLGVDPTATPDTPTGTGSLYGRSFAQGLASPFVGAGRRIGGFFQSMGQDLTEEEQVARTQRRADLANQVGRRTGMGMAGMALGAGLGLFTGGVGTLAMAGGASGLLGSRGMAHAANLGGGFVGGFLGRSSTANDTRGRRVAAGLGAATRFIGGSMTGVFKEPGVDMMSFFGQIPFGTRGLQGFTLLESLQNIAAPGELPALQASSLLGQGYSDVGLMGAMGGQLGQFADSLGMDRAMAAQMLMPLASGASNTIGSGAGRVSLQEIAAMTQAGMDVGGLLGNASSFGFQTGSTPSFAISNMAFNLGARGQQRTALTAQMQGMTQGFAAQNLVYGDDRSRARYLSRIYTMGQGNMSTGQAVFGRGAAVAERAKGSLASDYAGVAQSVLMAHAMRESGGNRLQALNYLENLQAQGGQAMLGILQQNGLDRETALMSLRAEGLSARDIIDIQAGNAGDSRFQVSGAAPSRITPATDAATALPTVSLKARESNRRIGLNYDNMDLSMQKAEYDQRSEEYFLEKARSAGDGLADLEKSLREFNSLMDDFIINQRQNFGSNLKTAMDPNADILPRIGAVLGSALYFGIAGFLEKNIGR